MWFGGVMMGISIDDADECVSSAVEQNMELGLEDEVNRSKKEAGMNMSKY
jgi:hypothetical protein